MTDGENRPWIESELTTIFHHVRNTAWVDGFWWGLAIGAFVGGAAVEIVRAWGVP